MSSNHNRNAPGKHDVLSGLLLMVGGGIFSWLATRYHMGTPNRMGPGFFPFWLGLVLMVVGAILLLQAVLTSRITVARVATGRGPSVVPVGGATTPTEPPLKAEWRGWLCILGGVAAFAGLGHYGGLVPATFAAVFISALGDRKNSIKDAFLLSLAMVVVAVLVFSWGLRLQLPLFTWG